MREESKEKTTATDDNVAGLIHENAELKKRVEALEKIKEQMRDSILEQASEMKKQVKELDEEVKDLRVLIRKKD